MWGTLWFFGKHDHLNASIFYANDFFKNLFDRKIAEKLGNNNKKNSECRPQNFDPKHPSR